MGGDAKARAAHRGRRLRPAYVSALAVVARRASVPFAYTLAIWGSTNTVASFAGPPSALEILLFVAGAAAAFAVTVLIALRADVSDAEPPPPTLLRTGLFQILAVLSAVLGAVVGTALARPLVWFLVGALATGAFLVVSALDVRFAAVE